MKKFILLLVLTFVACNSSAVTVITTPAELQSVANDLDGDYILGNDIDLSGFAWEPISYREDGVNISGSSGKWIGLLHKKRHDFIICGKI